MSLRGRIFDIQRCSIHDGPGIRTTVFLQGCPLACKWCHNPESIGCRPLLAFAADRCSACGACVSVCEHGCHLVEGERHQVERTRCLTCGACVTACPAGALEIVGREADSDAVLAEVERDAPFYATSGGGMTVSGGEPLLQAAFTLALLEGARARGIHTVVETSGLGRRDDLLAIAVHTDLFLYDLKHMDGERHRALTGVEPTRIHAHLRLLHDRGARIRVRLPLIPGMNDEESHLGPLIALLRKLPAIEGIEVMPYHRLGIGKRARFGLPEVEGLPENEATDAQQAAWEARLADAGVAIIAHGS